MSEENSLAELKIPPQSQLATPTNAQNALLAKKKDIPFFADLSAEEVLSVAKEVDFLRFEKGKIVFEQGECSRAIYYIVRGAIGVAMRRIDDDGKENFVQIAELPKRSFFGEMAFITGEPRSARTVSLEEDTAVLRFAIRAIEESPAATHALARVYLYFAQDLAAKLKITSADYAKIKTIDDVPYEELIGLITRARADIFAAAADSNVLSIDEELAFAIYSVFPNGYDPSATRDIVKTALIEALGLRDRDLIIFAKNRVVIRLFQERAEPIAPEQIEFPTLPLAPEAVLSEEQAKKVAALFGDRELFASEAFGAKSEAELGEFVLRLFESILIDPRYGAFLSFKMMKTYDNFKLSKSIDALFERFCQYAKATLENSYQLSDIQAEAALKTTSAESFLRSFAIDCAKQFRDDLTLMIADTFVQAASQATQPNEIPNAVSEAIAGTAQMASALTKNGVYVASRADLIKMRVAQAEKEKAKRMPELFENADRLRRQLNGTRKNIEALKKAALIKPETIAALSAERLRDIVVNEDGKENDWKRLLQFLPAGEMTQNLRDRVEKNAKFAKNEVAKEEFKRAEKFFDALHSNNTAKNLASKLDQMRSDLPKIEERLQAADAAIKTAQNRRLEEFDEGLSRIYDALIANIGKRNR